MDLVGQDLAQEWADNVRASLPEPVPVFPISSVAQRGLGPLKEELYALVQRQRAADDL